MKEIKRGEIYAVDFGTGFGSEQGGTRPSLILQNDIGNRHSPTTIVAAITGRKTKAVLPTHVKIMAKGLKTESTVLLEQIKTIDKERLGEYIGRLDSKTLAAVDRAIVAFAAMNAGMKIVSPFSAGGRYSRYRVGMADCVNIVGTVPLSANRADVLVVGGTTVTEAPGKRLCDDEDQEYNTCCRIAECGKLPVLR